MSRYALQFFGAVAVFLAVVFGLYAIGPDAILETLGVRNVYLTVFVLAIIGGVSAFSAAGYYATLFSFAVVGLNPFLLALASAPGVLIGDYIFWFLGSRGKEAIEEKYGHVFERFSRWLQRKPRWAVPLVIYVYTGLTPMPGDFLMIALALANYPFLRVIIPTLLGNYTLALLLSLSVRFL